MSTLIGVLLDVSGSMEKSVGEEIYDEGGEWVRSDFNVLDGLIKHDVSHENKIFAIAVGGRNGKGTFDLLNTLDPYHKVIQSNTMPKREIIEQALHLLSNSGAPYVRQWVKIETIDQVLSLKDAIIIYQELKADLEFRRRMAMEHLPDECRNTLKTLARECATVVAEIISSSHRRATPVVGAGVYVGNEKLMVASPDDVKEVVAKAKRDLRTKHVCNVTQNSVFKVQDASSILHGCIDNKEKLTNERVSKLLDVVRPYIFGDTPLITAMNEATVLFSMPQYEAKKKLLFILSDGDPSDGHLPPVTELRELNVTIVCCFITDTSVRDPKRLYNVEQSYWSEEQKFMYRLCSKIPTQLLPRTIFVKQGWTIDVTNNETKLFIQANHPDIISNACDLARNVVCCQDALTDVLSSVSLDMYINQSHGDFRAKKQIGGTCYANASAAVLHLAMHRIIGRLAGYPDFFSLRGKLIEKYGMHGASTVKVLAEVCPEYRLHFQEVNTTKAMLAITSKRPVLALFYLTDEEWDIFSEFYDNNPKGTLSRTVLDVKRRQLGEKLGGHAVVMTSFNSDCLRLMNSWGSTWADNGFFRVSNAEVLQLKFIDVYWTLNDLKQSEITAYNRFGAEVAAKLINSLTGLQTARYECPLCSTSSMVTEFYGSLGKVTCPRCRGEFDTDKAGNILALNIYLTSLCY